jgi:hypothetical protein
MLSHRVRFDDGPDDRAVELRLEGHHVLSFDCRWQAKQWVPDTKPFAKALWDFDAHAIRVSERAMPQALVDAANRAFGPLMRKEERPRQASLFPNACCVCGADRNTYPETAIRDGYGNICETRGQKWVTPDEPIRTPCHVCDRLVCRMCMLTRPDSGSMQEYYFHTYCSEACRRAAPSRFAHDDESMSFGS